MCCCRPLEVPPYTSPEAGPGLRRFRTQTVPVSAGQVRRPDPAGPREAGLLQSTATGTDARPARGAMALAALSCDGQRIVSDQGGPQADDPCWLGDERRRVHGTATRGAEHMDDEQHHLTSSRECSRNADAPTQRGEVAQGGNHGNSQRKVSLRKPFHATRHEALISY